MFSDAESPSTLLHKGSEEGKLGCTTPWICSGDLTHLCNKSSPSDCPGQHRASTGRRKLDTMQRRREELSRNHSQAAPRVSRLTGECDPLLPQQTGAESPSHRVPPPPSLRVVHLLDQRPILRSTNIC